ncbi:MAG: M20/M25/M40 family metallo-hydrolase [Pirellulales bacterium]|nr:M20/M25/M40 family metallo-hydrolase [Pirellulales bacterium]
MHDFRRIASRSLVALLGMWLFLPPAASGADAHAAFLAALESITPTELESHVGYLADDRREGREAGTRGGREAGDYLGVQLEALGFRGAGDEGTCYQRFAPNFRNLLAAIDGSDPELKQEWIILGAHYDHVGHGTKQNSKGPVGEIHNGADDNASGTSGVLEIAEALAMLPQPPRRSVLVAFWDAEEKGLLGSKHWLAHPTLPLDRVRLVVNVDMIGRLRNDRMMVMGSRTGFGLRRLLCQQNIQPDLLLEFPLSVLANADHYSFFGKGIPAFTFHTDIHEDYHRPTDDADRIDIAGMRRATQLMFRAVYDLANRDRLPAFREASRHESDDKPPMLPEKPAVPVRLGATWSGEPPSGQGVELKAITHESPAERAGLRAGDRLIRWADHEIGSSQELMEAVMTAEGAVKAVAVRADHQEPVELTVELQGEPLRLGIAWRVDDAEPEAVILTHVLRGSPADRAGLEVGDRIYQLAGSDFGSEREFADRIAHMPARVELLIERSGRIRRVVVEVEQAELRRAG